MTAVQPRRRYDSAIRRERAAQTRERIVTAGAELVRNTSIRDWRGVTIRAVAERAGVNERTVYRHFANERALRDAVMHRLEDEVGIDLSEVCLDDLPEVVTRLFTHVSAFRLETRPPLDPTLVEANRRLHDALNAAVAEHTAGWPAADRKVAAAALDVLWSVGSYERVVRDWQMGRDEAIRTITWMIGLVAQALREGRRPPRARRTTDDGD
jgi:AcrR family transcriptional regulator